MRGYLEQHGKPVALYSDKASVFHCNSHSVTQFGRALYELDVDTFCANSSQAKGRVERANLTLQDRLVKELRLHEISTKEAANADVSHFIADFNGQDAAEDFRRTSIVAGRRRPQPDPDGSCAMALVEGTDGAIRPG